jgi:hypothetical protein
LKPNLVEFSLDGSEEFIAFMIRVILKKQEVFSIFVCGQFIFQPILMIFFSRVKTGWLGIIIMCPSGVTSLSADCCFSELTV